MKWSLVKSLLWALLLFVQFHEYRCCIEEERVGLLELKAFLKPDFFPNSLSSWVNESSKCCDWEMVTCNAATGHIIKLSLSDVHLGWIFNDANLTWVSNMSLLQPFKELRSLELSKNAIGGWLGNEDLCVLKKLEELDLSHNYFEGILPPCLKNLTSLTMLDISYNQFSGNVPSSLIASLTSLEYIDLSHNFFEGLFSFSSFTNHSKLKVIDFTSENNKLEIETENPNWNTLFQLKALVLSNCNLNKLSGNIPTLLFDQRELEFVDLSHNKLKGSFPNWLLENNTELVVLNLQNNYFKGQFHLPPYRYKELSWLEVSNNHLNGQLQENIGKMIPHLEYLNLSQNNFQGNLPSSIGDMSDLRRLDLSNNNFSGEVPKELVGNSSQLIVLKLSNNRFHGEILFEHSSIGILELNNNHFTGTLPGVLPEYMIVLDFSNNLMSGIIPRWTRQKSRSTLLMSNNYFKGQIPCELDSFLLIDLSHNLLSGSFPSCLNLQDVNHLLLQGNKLTGSLPKVVFNSSSLFTLDIRDNRFSGNIPNEISGLSNLRILLLSGNHFSGMIPKQLCQLKKVGIMDLSNNSFSGTIPHCFYNITFGKIGAIERAYINGRELGGIAHGFLYTGLRGWRFEVEESGDEYSTHVGVEFVTKHRSNFYKGGILDFMSGLDLSFNKLTGGIPPELGQLSSIHALNLSYNQLIGFIPKTFSNLTQLESLDLSHNNLTGEIPSTLIDLHFLEVFNVAYNNLSGKVLDMKGQFGTFENSSYEGNPFLCGPPLAKSCTRIDISPPSPNASVKKRYEVDLLVFSISFSVSYVIFFFCVVGVLYINPYWQQRCFNLIEDRMYWCHDFSLNMLKALSNCICH